MVVYLGARLYQRFSSQAALATFDRELAKGPKKNRPPILVADEASDLSLWSDKRVAEYQDSLKTKFDEPLAVLSIAKLQLRVPVFEGTTDLVLNRGVGWIVGSGKFGETGNIGIAGHRDGFFRGLKDINEGDTLELTTLEARSTYVVDQIEIVNPSDVRVLQPRKKPSVTLVTCYPFYFIGSAPERYIVHASMTSSEPTVKKDVGEGR